MDDALPDDAGVVDVLCVEPLDDGLPDVDDDDPEVEPDGVEAVLPDEDGVDDDGEYVPSDVSDALPDPVEADEPDDEAPVLEVEDPEVDGPDDVEDPDDEVLAPDDDVPDVEEAGDVEEPLGVVDPLDLAGAVGNNPMSETDMVNSSAGVVCRSRIPVT